MIKTATGICQVSYNAENRPVLWECGTTNIVMKFDRKGRRVEYIETVNSVTNTHHRFVYDGYLCIQCLNALANNGIDFVFGWDPSEPVATRPLILQKYGQYNMFYTHDGNKNVSELVFFQQANGIAAHYEYAPFGAVTATSRSTPVTAYDFREYNPFRFSSEYNDNLLGLAYYNYRHYCPLEGRFLAFDMFYELHIVNSYLYSCNDGINYYDSLGNLPRVQGKNSTWPTIAPNPNDYSCAKEMPTIYGEVPSGSCCQYSEKVVYANNVVEFTADGSGGYIRKGELCVSGAKCKYIKVRQCLGDRAYVERTLLIQQINGIWRKSDM